LQDRQAVPGQRLGDFRTNLGALDRTGHHESRFQLAVGQLDALLDQIHEVRGCPNVVGRRLHRDQHAIGGLHCRHGQVMSLRRSVDHNKVFPGHAL
jgi:hypothetical protein